MSEQNIQNTPETPSIPYEDLSLDEALALASLYLQDGHEVPVDLVDHVGSFTTGFGDLA